MLVLLAVPIESGKTKQSTTDADGLVNYLRREAHTPADYVLSKVRDHRIIIVGENHWVKHDANLILELIPRLKDSGVTALGVEMFRDSDQGRIDEAVTGPDWNPAAAMSVMRSASWPYREYLEIIHAVWKINQTLPRAERLKLLALGPEMDWRTRLLPLGQTYDTFMAQTVKDYLSKPQRRILIYCGAHHAFTRYYQPELPRGQRVEQFMNRMGNVLWRDFGEEVFMITLHRPWQCRTGEKWTRCLPLNGTIDCAAASIGHPVGFDAVRSPFAELKVAPEFLYSLGYSSLRLGDITDGYIWTIPIESYKAVDLLPLSEFAPDPPSLEYVSENNPFSDKRGLGRSELESLASAELARLRDFVKSSGWENLAGWHQRCKK
jgi:hypothetical protein